MKKSFKVLFALAMMFSVALSASAQFEEADNNRVPDRFHMGIRAGSTVNTYFGDVSNVGSLWFPMAGIAMDFQVAPFPLFVGVGLNYENLGYRDLRWEDEDAPYFEDMVEGHSIHMPVTASYHINLAPNLFLNPHAGFFMAYDLTELYDEETYEFDDNRFNYGLRIGCGANFGRLTLDMGYDLGLKNFARYDGSIHSGTFFMTIGFNWAGSR